MYPCTYRISTYIIQTGKQRLPIFMCSCVCSIYNEKYMRHMRIKRFSRSYEHKTKDICYIHRIRLMVTFFLSFFLPRCIFSLLLCLSLSSSLSRSLSFFFVPSPFVLSLFYIAIVHFQLFLFPSIFGSFFLPTANCSTHLLPTWNIQSMENSNNSKQQLSRSSTKSCSREDEYRDLEKMKK